MDFVKLLRKGSGGKPIGIKICIGNKTEFVAICKAMVETKTYLDFITVDGGEGGTGAAPQEYSDHVGMPLRDALAFVYDCLNGFGIKDQIKIIASGKVVTGFDIIRCLSIGADLCNSARGMMFALGCIQALQCDSGKCPVGIATQDKSLYKGLDITDKRVRVANFHKNTLKAVAEFIGACGFESPDQVTAETFFRRVNYNTNLNFKEIYFTNPETKNKTLDKETIFLN